MSETVAYFFLLVVAVAVLIPKVDRKQQFKDELESFFKPSS